MDWDVKNKKAAETAALKNKNYSGLRLFEK
jgi:hypothetical protein